jgi:hypothetical protein
LSLATPFRSAALAAALLLAAVPALADGIGVEIETSPRAFSRFGSITMPAGLTFLGGLELSSSDGNFDGFSGLDVSPDGKSFLSVSDRGYWLRGEFVYRDGLLSGVSSVQMAPIRNTAGKVDERKSRSDAESVAAWSADGIGGKVIVGYERRERVEQFNLGKRGLAAPAKAIRSPQALGEGE